MADRQPDTAPSLDSRGEVPLGTIPLHSTNLLTVLDETGVVRYESPSIERVFGFEQDALVGERVAEYFHPEDREDVLAAFRAVVASDGGAIEAVEYRHRRADGSYTWVESVTSADTTPEGYYVVNTRDISDQKERERRLRATNERLDAFVGIVSHDLRNPLNVAEGRLGLAREECDSDHLDDAAAALGRMGSLVDDLLTLARAERHEPRTETLELAAVAEACWETVPTADATLAIDTDRTLAADRSRLRQLLENLIGNAVEHGGGGVTVTVGALDDGFYVEDDGSGIPDGERDRVFDAGLSSSGDGTGLGLSIARRVAEAHGWAIGVTDGPGGGARFEITGVEP